jgi:hypothetical protein
MKNFFRRHSRYTLHISIILIVFSFVLRTGDAGLHCLNAAEAAGQQEYPAQGHPAVLDKSNPQIQAVIAIQNRHTPQLFTLPEVVGTATGLSDDNSPAVLVFTRGELSHGKIPDQLDEVPVVINVTGEFYAFKPGEGVGSTGKNKSFSTTKVLPLPVPIGVSAGNANECSAGTIGARVTDGNNVYALSNNHVFALENEASIGSTILQPGFYDTRCRYRGNNIIGTLSDWVPIVFNDPNVCNYADAAIASTTQKELSNSTPPDGYGTPTSQTTPASVGMQVQKYGRTSLLTRGTITGINAIITVSYSSGPAKFCDQIIVSSSGPFIKPGDSGSLMVTDPGLSPVGLLFAGDSSGTMAVANPIADVLSSLAVTIDGN